ncbi:MAG: PAS domain S-box protein [Campylobacterales bacterium]|nr:PAS domain S-box protein [Campylobacterales bacterium]
MDRLDLLDKRINEAFNLTDLILKSFEHSYNSVVITTADLTNATGPLFLYVNPAFLKKTGYTWEELEGKTPKILQGEKTDRVVLDRLKETLLRGDYFQGDTINYTKDGSEYHVEWNISPLKDENGEIRCFLSIQRDITSEVLLKQTMEKKLLLKNKHSSLGEMIEVITHQWKQSLNRLALISQQLEMDEDLGTEINKEYIEKHTNEVMEQIDFMSQTIGDFTNFFKPDRKKQTFDVVKAIKQIISLLQPQINKAEITVEIKETHASLYGNTNDFKHVIINLIKNALDALTERKIDNGKITIFVETIEQVVQIKVIDNGGGIPKDILENLFTSYNTSKQNGTGIGLKMSKMIIESVFNGEIHGQNGNTGAEFTIKI